MNGADPQLVRTCRVCGEPYHPVDLRGVPDRDLCPPHAIEAEQAAADNYEPPETDPGWSPR